MLIVLIFFIGAAPVCLSWLWSRIVPWLHWPFRLNFVIKTESPKDLPKLLLDLRGHLHATLCQWDPGVLICGQPIRHIWASCRLAAVWGYCPRSKGWPWGQGWAQPSWSHRYDQQGAASSLSPAASPVQSTSSLLCTGKSAAREPCSL